MQTGSVEDVLQTAFLALVLMLRDREAAESTLIEAIDELEPGSGLDDLLLLSAFFGVSRRLGGAEDGGDLAKLKWLPQELLRVCELPSDARTVFVLRVLLRVPSATVEAWLSESEQSVRDKVAEAAVALSYGSGTANSIWVLPCRSFRACRTSL